MRSDREFDLIVYGATGFTGQLLKRGAPNGVEDGGGEGVGEVVESDAESRHRRR